LFSGVEVEVINQEHNGSGAKRGTTLDNVIFMTNCWCNKYLSQGVVAVSTSTSDGVLYRRTPHQSNNEGGADEREHGKIRLGGEQIISAGRFSRAGVLKGGFIW